MKKGNNTQTPATRALSRAIRKFHRESKSWLKTAIHFNITSADGTPNKGMAYLIANGEYEPKDPQLRIKLGLPIIECPTCHARIKQVRLRKWKRLDDLESDQIIYLLDHRESMQAEEI